MYSSNPVNVRYATLTYKILLSSTSTTSITMNYIDIFFLPSLVKLQYVKTFKHLNKSNENI